MSSELRWTVLVVVLTVAGVVARWPRPDAYPDASSDTRPVPVERLAERPDDAALGPGASRSRASTLSRPLGRARPAGAAGRCRRALPR
ncbi:hypothetical protein GCM10017691_19990 [Pseudonocardia petroleophila]